MLIIQIDESRFQAKSLFGSKVVDGNVVGIVFMQSIKAKNTTDNMVGRE